MGRDQGNEGGRSGSGGGQGSSDRGFAAMDDEEQRKIADKGGEKSARIQDRDDQGQFGGTSGGSGSSRGGGSQGGGSQGGGSQGGASQGGGNPGGGSRSGGGGGNR